jgi:hypothetical protein
MVIPGDDLFKVVVESIIFAFAKYFLINGFWANGP